MNELNKIAMYALIKNVQNTVKRNTSEKIL